MSVCDPKLTLEQMRDFATRAHALTKGRAVEQVAADDMLRGALERYVSLVGEAATRLDRLQDRQRGCQMGNRCRRFGSQQTQRAQAVR